MHLQLFGGNATFNGENMKLPEGTTMLDIASPTFTTDLANAIGLQPGENLEIVTPRFERTDGMQVPVLVDFDDWENLHKKDEATLRALGFGVWDETEKGKHWLFPKEWYDSIPDGYPITDICGNQKEFKRGETDDDYRFGCLAFGFIQEPQTVLVHNVEFSGDAPLFGAASAGTQC